MVQYENMKNYIQYSFFSLITFILVFVSLEGLSRIFFVRPGASDFIERRIIEQGLTKHKAKDEFRIFLYGESTMQGDALCPKFTVEKWISIYLKDLLGSSISRKVKVYNLARLGSNSHFISQSFYDTIYYKPDLVVFYTAHNDFVQLDNRHTNFNPQPLTFGEKGFLKHFSWTMIKQSAFLSELTRLHIRLKIELHKRQDKKLKKHDLPSFETWEKFYDPQYDAYDHDSYVFKTILAHWIRNINQIIHVAQKRQLPVIFLEGISNFKEYYPNESTHSPSLTAPNLFAWEEVHQKAERAFSDKNYVEAAKLYQKSLELDPEYAMTYYRLGQCYENLSEFGKANEYYLTANDKDRVPLRAPSEVNRFYDSLEREKLKGITVIKTKGLFEQYSPNGIIDGKLLLDPVHPTVDGQALMSLEIVKSIYTQGWVAPKASWHWDQLGPTDDYEKELGLDQDFKFNIYLNKAIFVGRFYSKAVEYSEKALAIRPDSIEAKRQLAWTYWRMGNKEKASTLYQEIYEKWPGSLLELFKKYPELGNGVIISRRRSVRRIPLQSIQAL